MTNEGAPGVGNPGGLPLPPLPARDFRGDPPGPTPPSAPQVPPSSGNPWGVDINAPTVPPQRQGGNR